MKISPARTAAFDILLRVESERAYSSVLLPEFEENLSPKDRGLCHELTLGALRRQLYLDKIIEQFTTGKRLDLSVAVSLRLGLYQLLFLDKIPAYSAINDSVNLVQRAKKTSAKGLVNAILRRATREKIELNYLDEMDRISVESSHPRWLIEKWQRQFGADEAEQLAKANNKAPGNAFRFTLKAAQSHLATVVAAIRASSQPSAHVEGCFFAESVSSELLAASAEGVVYFQDEASQMVGNSVGLSVGESFLDVCAAPGSKTTQIAANQNSNTLMVAGDIYRPRVEFLRENCGRQGVGFVKIVQYDAERELPFADRSFDAVLIDAPCSGTGTIRHNPEIRYFLDPADFEQLSKKQLQIAVNASKLVKPGGRLIYSTCSMEIEENEEVIGSFLKASDGFEIAMPRVPGQFVGDGDFARTFPHRDSMDGFFIAQLNRTH